MMNDDVVGPPQRAPVVDWRAVIGGAMIAAGISFTLLAFGSAIGLSVVSTAPTWRDSSPVLWFLSGIFLVFVALCSFGGGGYFAGRMRLPTGLPAGRESDFRDGMHGLLTWGLAILLSAVLAIAGAATASHQLTPLAAGAGPSASADGEGIIATELDELFRGDRLGDPGFANRRAEAARILLRSSSHKGVPDSDRVYLAGEVSARTGLGVPDASDRVNRIIAESADALHRAREAAVVEAFMVAAALLLGAAVTWFAAIEGGRERTHGTVPAWGGRFGLQRR